MNAISAKSLALWGLVVAAWLVVSAILSMAGVPVIWLIMLHLGALALVLSWMSRATAVSQAAEFLVPDTVHDGPNALTPYGSAASWLSGFGTIGLVAMILMQGGGAFVIVAAVLGAMGIVSILIAPILAEGHTRSLCHWLIWRFGARSGKIVRTFLVLSGMAVLIVQMSFAGMLVQAGAGLPPLVVLPVMAMIILLTMVSGGFGSAMPAQAVLFLVLLVGVLVPALWLGLAKTGIAMPHLAAGALLHESTEVRTRLGIESTEEPFAAAMLGLTVLCGLVALPHTLMRWSIERSGAGARYFARRGMVMAVIVVVALPLFAIAVRAEIFASALASRATIPVFATAEDAISGAVAVLGPSAWLLAACSIGALAAIAAASASAVLLVVDALGRDPSTETAGGVLSGYRWVSFVAVGVATVFALLMPFDPLAAFFVVLAIATSAVFAPLMLALLWSGLNGAGALAGLLTGGATCAALMAMGWSIEEGAALLGMLLSSGIAVAVSIIWPANGLSARVVPVSQD